MTQCRLIPTAENEAQRGPHWGSGPGQPPGLWAGMRWALCGGSEVKVLIFSTPQVVPLTHFSNTVLPVKQKTSSWEESTHLRLCPILGHALELGGTSWRLCPDCQKWRVFFR